MSSPGLVCEVLAASGLLEKDNLESRFLESCRRIEDIKYEVAKSISNISGEIHSIVSGVEENSKELKKLSTECNQIKNDIENLKPQLLSVVNQSDKVDQELQKATVVSDILRVLVETHNSFTDFDNYLAKYNFYKAAEIIEKCNANIKSLKYIFAENLDIINAICFECTVKNERLKYELGFMWMKMFLWNCDSDNGIYKLSIFGADDDSKGKALSFLKTLAKFNVLDQRLKSFGTSFLNYLVKPILKKSIILKQSKENSYAEIELVENNNRGKTDPEEVFKNLSTIFCFLNEMFLNIIVSTPSFQNEVPLARILGKCIADEFCEVLISEDLLECTKSIKSESFSTIAEHATKLQNQLVEIKFLDDDANVFGNTQNFNSIISNKMCQEIFSRARKTMKRELHQTIRVQVKAATSEETDLDEEECTTFCIKNINQLYNFPDCVVSLFIEDLLKQLKELSIQATCSSAIAAPRLYFAARYICELFCDIVPIYHQHNIMMFPQQTAIHHNNCMYLAHELLILSTTWQFDKGVKVKTSTQDNLTNELVISFVDLSKRLKSIGTMAFLAQMKRQKQQLMEFLQDGSVFRNLTTISDFLPKGQKALHQCLHQLKSLRQLWIDVLPPDVYLKAMGTLCNSVIEEIIFQVTSQEDITEKVTEFLETLFEIILNDMPPLFQVEKYKTKSDLSLCQNYVSKWTKFQELKWIIVSSLHNIVERWAEGAGPLAMVFAPDEVKQLIRALFQNTERRSAALYKIVSLTTN